MKHDRTASDIASRFATLRFQNTLVIHRLSSSTMLVVAPACLGFASTPLSASPTARLANPCAGKKPNFPNANCFTEDGDPNVPEQAAADVTKGAISEANDMFANQTAGTPIMTSYSEAGLCPVNVHWHVGAEHRSAGQYDENGTAPSFSPNWSFGGSTYNGRRLAAGQTYRHGHKCHHYNASDPAYTTPVRHAQSHALSLALHWTWTNRTT